MKKTKILFLIIAIVFLVSIAATSRAVSYTLNVTGDVTVEVNKTVQLKASFQKENDEGIPGIEQDVTATCTWTSSDSSIATVDTNGVVTGVKAGEVRIIANYIIPDTDNLECISEFEMTVIGPNTSNPEHQWTDVSTIQFSILREDDKFCNYKIKVSDFTANENSEYYIIITGSANDKPVVTQTSTGQFETNHDAFLLNNTNYTFFTSINNYIEKSDDIYVWFYEYAYVDNAKQLEELVSGREVERPSQLPVGTRLNGYFFNDKTTIFNYTILSETPRFVKVKIGPVTDINLLQNIKDNKTGALANLLSYAKAANNPIFEQYIPLGDSDSVTNNLNMSDKAYYYVYMELDDEAGTYYPLEDISLYQGTVSDSVGKNLFNYLDSNFTWNLETETPDPDPTPTPQPSTPTNNNDPTTANLPIPNTGKGFLIIGFISLIVIVIFSYFNSKKYKEIK